jgi:predicted DsbA family dithiol-disulfide isomerase
VRQDQKEGAEAGITGTPSFLLGLTDHVDPEKFHATRLLRGALSYIVFRQTIESLLAQARTGS